MSIILNALEKSQREAISKKKTQFMVDKEPIVAMPKVKKRSRRIYNVYFWAVGVICVVALNCYVFKTWLNKDANGLVSDIVSKSTVVVSSPVKATTDSSSNKITEKDIFSLLRVEGVVWDSYSPLALVNGQVLNEGDKILGAEIKDIQTDKITFLYQDKEIVKYVD